MSELAIRAVSAGGFFVLIFLSGLWLSHSGKPYSMVLFNLHKLIGLGALIFLAFTAIQVNKAAALSPVELAACLVTAVIFASTIVSGGLVSLGKPLPAAIAAVHRLLPYFTVIATAATFYLLLNQKPQ